MTFSPIRLTQASARPSLILALVLMIPVTVGAQDLPPASGPEATPYSTGEPAVSFTSGATIPASLPWPIAAKSVKDVSLFFWVEDAVGGVGKNCNRGPCGAMPGTGEIHYPNHLGIDIAASAGTKVHPVADGCVEYVKQEGSGLWKWYVVVSHGPSDGRNTCPNPTNTWTTVYWHLDKVDTTKIAAGKTVTTSSILGEVADLDAKTGDIDHLHFGIRAAAYDLNESRRGYADCSDTTTRLFVNPLTFLKRPGTTLLDDNYAILSGSWVCSDALPFYYGTGYRTLLDSTTGSATYRFEISASGRYKVYARWSPNPNRTSRAVFTITHGATTQSVTKDQTAGNGQWTELTTMDMLMSVPLVVKIQNGAKRYLISDAVLIERQ